MKDERIVGTCEGEKRKNEMLYNLIMHKESTVFSYASENTVDII
jgi:hypothetical protein